MNLQPKRLRHYSIFPDGRVYNELTDRWLKPTAYNAASHLRGRAPKYYMRVRLFFGGVMSNHLLHRLVARMFVPNPRPDLFDIVDHINGDGLDNRAENLRWVNQKLNSMRRVRRPRFVEGYGWRITVNYRKNFFPTREEAQAHAEQRSLADFDREYNRLLNSPIADDDADAA